MENSTPKAVIDQYVILSDEDQSAFCRLLGQQMAAEQLWMMLNALPLPEQARFIALLDRRFSEIIMPKLILDMIRAVRASPQATEEELARVVEKEAAGYFRDITKLAEAEVKKKRDPKKRNVARDAEIIRLAKQGKTSGEIRREIKSRWKCTPGAVNQVIMRAKHDGRLPT